MEYNDKSDLRTSPIGEPTARHRGGTLYAVWGKGLGILVIGGLVCAMTVEVLAARGKTIKCSNFSVAVPPPAGGSPQLDSAYPSEATIFHFENKKSLLLVAMDEDDPTRLRIALSAQWDKKSNRFKGQVIEDLGSSQLQIQNGPETCAVMP
jgi:hypothetical protein